MKKIILAFVAALSILAFVGQPMAQNDNQVHSSKTTVTRHRGRHKHRSKDTRTTTTMNGKRTSYTHTHASRGTKSTHTRTYDANGAHSDTHTTEPDHTTH
jgi:Ni/Co efflux regulator RcnB